MQGNEPFMFLLGCGGIHSPREKTQRPPARTTSVLGLSAQADTQPQATRRGIHSIAHHAILLLWLWHICLLLLVASPALSQNSSQRFVLSWVANAKDKRRVAVEVSWLTEAELQALRQTHRTPEQWQQILAVRVQQGTTPDNSTPPMLGNYRVQGKKLRFEPQFPLQPNVTYLAVFSPNALPNYHATNREPLTARFTLTVSAPAPTTTVTGIYPSASILPENLLKFYIEFSAPMSRGQIYEHIHLRDAEGQAIELPFLEINEELWDTTGKRLTLFLDPGRIKRGVRPLEEIGASLQAGKRYTLTIDSTWKDGNGVPLTTGFEKAFQVGQADRTPLAPIRWTLTAPKSGSKTPLVVGFDEPLDYALARRMIQVVDAAGKAVPGKITLSHREQRWTFQPSAAWRRGTYRLIIQTTLEDLAGNNIGKPFDVDLHAAGQHSLTAPTISRKFSVR
jgi:hypothetical protein